MQKEKAIETIGTQQSGTWKFKLRVSSTINLKSLPAQDYRTRKGLSFAEFPYPSCKAHI